MSNEPLSPTPADPEMTLGTELAVFYQETFAPKQPVVFRDDPYLPPRISWKVDDLEWPPLSAPSPELRARLRIEIGTRDGWRLATEEDKDMCDASAPRTFRWVWDRRRHE